MKKIAAVCKNSSRALQGLGLQKRSCSNTLINSYEITERYSSARNRGIGNEVSVVISSDRVLRGRIRLWLAQMGCKALTATSPTSALQLLQTFGYIPMCFILDSASEQALDELCMNPEVRATDTPEFARLFTDFPFTPVLTLEEAQKREIRQKAQRSERIPLQRNIRRKDFRSVISEILTWHPCQQ